MKLMLNYARSFHDKVRIVPCRGFETGNYDAFTRRWLNNERALFGVVYTGIASENQKRTFQYGAPILKTGHE